MSNIKGLQLKGTQPGKILTTDEQGKAMSTNINVENVATKDITNNLADRIASLEGQVTTAIEKARDING